MTSNLIDKDSIHSSSSSSSSSSIIVHDNYREKSLLLSCCGCSRTYKNSQSLLRTVEDTNLNEQQCFFKRIQFFKAKKRKRSARKQYQETVSFESTAANGRLVIETEKLSNDNEKQQSNITLPSSSEFHRDLFMKYSHRPLRNSQSIPYLNQFDTMRNLNNSIDSYSFTDIEVASSINEENNEQICINQCTTPISIVSNNFSFATTNLSTYSTQSLLRKLLDKAQVLDEYYNNIVNRNANQTLSFLSKSSNSLLGRSNATSCSVLHRFQSNDSFKKSSRRKYHHFNDSSRCNLYTDEDNILRELIRFNNDIDLILSRLEMEGESLQQQQQQQQQTTNHSLSNENLIQETNINPTDDTILDVNPQTNDQEEIEQKNLIEIITMRTDNNNEINIHLLLSNDINRLRESALSKLIKMTQDNCNSDNVHNYETITLVKLHKLPKSTTWKGKRVFGVPLRIYQQTTGHILPIAIINALQYIRTHANKCDGLFRKPGVKSKIDHLRTQIEATTNYNDEKILETIKFDEYQPFVVADVIRQYFRELPECIIPPSITRLLCDLFKCVAQEEQLLAIRYTFLILPDESREVLETILRFLLDVSIRSGNNQITCRNLARIFLPSVFQSFYDIHHTSSKILWWKWKKEKQDTIQQENERLLLEHCLMTMILNVDLLCRIPSTLTDELKLPSVRKTQRLDELVRNACNGEFHMKKYISKNCEEFFQRLSNIKFKNVQTNIDGVNISIHKPSITSTLNTNENNLPIWKCSIDIPNTNVKQVYQRILNENCLWNNHFAESRTVEKIDDDKEIVQYVINLLDFIPVRSFCEFRFSKKVTLRSAPDANAILISAISIDHLQNHFLPGSIGVTYNMHYYLKPSTIQPGNTTVTQVACVDYSGRSTQWYENVYGSLLAHNLISLRDTFTNAKIVRV
ncbi:unnamed protein product [Rotaria sordida]|uniref:Rho-GAP domain-containing protein n=1 Tax=Rotaria sordida TaxID=392033 RepID=A0A818LV18_9BILA|nr:unnamed protein product [Rotaria sordida]CAF3575859.1 unnamed protein product [Rotaria sordida]